MCLNDLLSLLGNRLTLWSDKVDNMRGLYSKLNLTFDDVAKLNILYTKFNLASDNPIN